VEVSVGPAKVVPAGGKSGNRSFRARTCRGENHRRGEPVGAHDAASLVTRSRSRRDERTKNIIANHALRRWTSVVVRTVTTLKIVSGRKCYWSSGGSWALKAVGRLFNSYSFVKRQQNYVPVFEVFIKQNTNN